MKFKEAMSPRMKAKFPKYTPRIREPGEALPFQINVMDGEYKPEPMQCVRAGADHSQKLPSRGLRT